MTFFELDDQIRQTVRFLVSLQDALISDHLNSLLG